MALPEAVRKQSSCPALRKVVSASYKLVPACRCWRCTPSLLPGGETQAAFMPKLAHNGCAPQAHLRPFKIPPKLAHACRCWRCTPWRCPEARQKQLSCPNAHACAQWLCSSSSSQAFQHPFQAGACVQVLEVHSMALPGGEAEAVVVPSLAHNGCAQWLCSMAQWLCSMAVHSFQATVCLQVLASLRTMAVLKLISPLPSWCMRAGAGGALHGAARRRDGGSRCASGRGEACTLHSFHGGAQAHGVSTDSPLALCTYTQRSRAGC